MSASGIIESVVNARESEDGSDLCDAVLLADGNKFPVHTFILSLRSPFFKAFFFSSLSNKTGDLIEEDEQPSDPKKLKVDARKVIVPTVFKIDQDPKVLEKILQFIYGDEKYEKLENYELAKATLIAANQYLLPKYETICGTFLIQFADFKFVELYNIAIMLKNEPLLMVIRRFACSNASYSCELKRPDCYVASKGKGAYEKFKELTLPAINDFFKTGVKKHPNEAILMLHQYFRRNQDKNSTSCMESLFDNIEWPEVKLETIKLVSDQGYLTKESLVKALFTRSKEVEWELCRSIRKVKRDVKEFKTKYDMSSKDSSIQCSLHQKSYSECKRCLFGVFENIEELPETKE